MSFSYFQFHLVRSVFFASMALAATQTLAQNYEIKVRTLGYKDVLNLIASNRHEIAREVALQCAKETTDTWCKFLAGTLIEAGKGGPSDLSKGFAMIKESADLGNAGAQAHLYIHFINNDVGQKSEASAIRYLFSSANGCNTFAQNGLARFYIGANLHKPNACKTLAEIRIPTSSSPCSFLCIGDLDLTTRSALFPLAITSVHGIYFICR